VSIYLYFGLIYLLYGYRLVGMAVAAPTLAPLFRSSQQMRLLAEIFYGQPAPGAELARCTGECRHLAIESLASGVRRRPARLTTGPDQSSPVSSESPGPSSSAS
jgi:hypothetical protein